MKSSYLIPASLLLAASLWILPAKKVSARAEYSSASAVLTAESPTVQMIRAQVAAGGTVTVPTGVHYFYAPLVFKQNNTMPTSLVGGGPEVSIMDFSQMADTTQTALTVDRQWGYRIQGVTIRGSGATNGGIGIDVNTTTPNANGSYGTCSGQSVWDHLTIAGFTKGVRIGNRDSYIAASEMEYRNVKVVMCKTCFELNDFNTLNHYFTMLQVGQCDYGILTNGASSVSVNGGSASSVRLSCFMFGSCDKASVRDFRMEESSNGVTFATTTTTCQCVLDNCYFHQRAGLNLEDTGNVVKNAIYLAAGGPCMTLTNCSINSTYTLDTPILWAHNGNAGALIVNGGCCSCTVNLVRVGNLPNLLPGKLAVNNMTRTNSGHDVVPGPNGTGFFDANGQ